MGTLKRLIDSSRLAERLFSLTTFPISSDQNLSIRQVKFNVRFYPVEIPGAPQISGAVTKGNEDRYPVLDLRRPTTP